jgi:hypothetical protein
MKFNMLMLGTPGRIRTYDLWYRKPTLYPSELRARQFILTKVILLFGFGFVLGGVFRHILRGDFVCLLKGHFQNFQHAFGVFAAHANSGDRIWWAFWSRRLHKIHHDAVVVNDHINYVSKQNPIFRPYIGLQLKVVVGHA